MANSFYQSPVPRPTAVRAEPAPPAPRLGGEVIHRLARLARALRLRWGVPGLRDRAGKGAGGGRPSGRDVLWCAKCNALHRALADHDLTPPQARAILCRLGAARDHGCELVALGTLTGLDVGVLDRAVPLLGLQNFITVSETSPRGCSGPVLWVSVTEHGLRYAAEAPAVSAFAPRGAARETYEERA